MTASPLPPQLPKAFGHSTRGRNAGDYADRHFAGQINLANGHSISLAVVADGFGERNLAPAVAQLAIDTLLEYFRRAKLTTIPEMLGQAYQVANKRLCEIARRHGNLPLSTTLAVAIIHENKLYIANVGNSRIYLLRGGRMMLLTVDHTVAYEQITSGRMTTDMALRQPNAQQLARSIGFDPKHVDVDLGLYLQGGGETAEQARQQQGLELHPNDLVLICSDGLVKPSPTDALNKGPLASREEIRRLMESNPGRQAAQGLANLAAQRLAAEDATAIILEMPGRSMSREAAILHQAPRPVTPTAGAQPAQKTTPNPNRKLLWISMAALLAFAALATLVVIVLFGFSYLGGSKATATSLPTDTPIMDLQTPTLENVEFPPNELHSATPALQFSPTPTSTNTITPQRFAPTATTPPRPTDTATPTQTFSVLQFSATVQTTNQPGETPEPSSTPTSTKTPILELPTLTLPTLPTP